MQTEQVETQEQQQNPPPGVGSALDMDTADTAARSGDLPPRVKMADAPAEQPPEDPPEPETKNDGGAESQKSAMDAETRKRFAALSRQERELRAQQNELKQQREELAQIAKLRELKEKDPYAAFKELGLSYEEITRRILNDGKPDPVEEARKELEDLKAWRQQQEEKRQQEEQQSAWAETEKQALAEIDQVIQNNADAYKLTQALNLQAQAWGTIQSHHAETGELMPYDEALERVESALKTDLEKLIEAGVIQWKQAGQPEAPAAPPKQTPSSAQASEAAATLTNNMTGAPTREARKETEEDRLKRAIEKLTQG